MDIFLCVVTLPLTLPVILMAALAVVLDSPGPAFFIQERAGKDGKRFKIYKFRTMQHDVDDALHRAFMKAFVQGNIGKDENVGGNGIHTDEVQRAFEAVFVKEPPNGNGNVKPGQKVQVYKPFQPSEVTRVGHILRRTSLDELPQIFNVLKGEMSWVGPRPNVLWEVEAYQDWHRERLEVLPGITGLAQVNGRSCIDFDTIVQYDIEYVRNRSLKLDVKILWQTIFSVFDTRGAL
jgi:lipopolysaccharide/colanic/teichoic acid biosynthesis glycosyltransferase